MSFRTLKSAVARQLASRFPRLWMERELRFRPNHFEDELWLTPIFCDKEKTSIDIGANMGHYSYYMAKFSGNVIAFEPNRDLSHHLGRLLGRRVRLESVALSSTSGKAAMRIDQTNTGVATLEEKNDLSCVADQSAVVTREIETRTLDSFNFSNVAMIKIDVEGHEEAVLAGAHQTILRNRPVLIVESEDRHNSGAPRRIAESLAAFGYLGFYLKDHRLWDFSALRVEDTNPKNIDLGLPYINNFIFIPAAQPQMIERAKEGIKDMSARSNLGTLAIVAVYAIVMASTNTRFTILDDESNIVIVAGHPILPTLKLFLSGSGQHEHPPFSDMLLHLWLLATNYSLFSLRIFANIFFIAAILFIACSAAKLAGTRAYWTTLVMGLAWPFAFQYGRITGWYCVTMFLVSALTWVYLKLLDDKGYGPWACFAFVGILLLWCNYFGVAILFLLLLDFILFHRALAIKNIKPLLLSAAVIALSFVPLIRIVLENVSQNTEGVASTMGWKSAVAEVGYPVFSIFGSVAVAPWFLPMSIPIFVATVVLFVSIWFSPGRHWFVYCILSMILLFLSGHMNIKRVLFLLPWLFIAMGMAACAEKSSYPKLASGAIAVLVVTGWIGIFSGNHYATTNLREPWSRVAQVVADDARRGATVISENPPFFFYLDYQLGLAADSQFAPGPYMGQSLYQSHGYKILQPEDWRQLGESLRGKIVVVNGSGNLDYVQWTNALDARLSQRCKVLGEYKAARDPSLLLKKGFTKNAPTLTYRVDVTWFDCTNQGG